MIAEYTLYTSEELNIMEAMLVEMEGYLQRDDIYGPMPSHMPRLTLGGYLMRQHRLQAIAQDLEQAQYEQLQQYSNAFEAILSENVVASEAKAYKEFAARLTQWSNFLAELKQNPEEYEFEYQTAVENRVMLAELLKLLALPPYKLNEDLQTNVQEYDELLETLWVDGDFVWEDVWLAAYPKSVYWWLYGEPTKPLREDTGRIDVAESSVSE